MIDPTAQLHTSAIIESGATIEKFTSVWHFSHVESSARIGENCNLGQNTYIGNNAIVGNACRIGNSVSIFANVELEDFVFCAPFMVFSHISYPRAAVTRKQIFAKTLVKKGATLGANSTITPGVVVGMGAFLAAGAVLTKSCRDWSLMVGVPARQVGWVSAYGERIDLPMQGVGKWVCSHTGDIYKLDGEKLSRTPGLADILEYVPGVIYRRLVIEGK